MLWPEIDKDISPLKDENHLYHLSNFSYLSALKMLGSALPMSISNPGLEQY